MKFITLARWKVKPTKQVVAQTTKLFEQATREGAKILAVYWTLGKYDAVVISEGKDEKAAMKAILRFGEMLSTQTMVAITNEEGHALID